MMVPSSRPNPEDEAHEKPSVDIPREDDEDEAPEEVVLGDRQEGGDALRQRRTKTDAMDVDD